MIEQAFEVATEFRFDVGQALLSTKQLQDAVQGVSGAANNALGSLSYLASGLVAHLGFGSGGILSVLSQAVKTSEEWNQSSLDLSNNISANFKVLAGTIDTFNDRLATSKMIMGNISDQAIKFGLPTADLARMTNMLATPLANRGKLGTNYEGAIGMSRNIMLAAHNTGINPQAATESVYRAMTDHMALHGALFARLVNTPAFKNAHIQTQHQFMNMNQDKKIDLLSSSLEKLAGGSQELAAYMNQLSTQFTVLKDHIMVVLKPIGDALSQTIVKIFKWANDYLGTYGKQIGANLGKLLSNIFSDPKALLTNLLQLRAVTSDFHKALKITELVQMFTFLTWGLSKLGVVFDGGLLRAGLGFLVDGLVAMAAWIWNAGIIGSVFKLLVRGAGAFLEVFAPIVFFLQIISRARAIAAIADVENWFKLAPRLAELLVRLKTAFESIMMPINMAIDFWARLLAPLFQTSTMVEILLPLFEGIASVMEFLGESTIYALAGLSGLTNAIIGFVYDLSKFKNPFGNVMKNLTEGVEDFIKKNENRLGGDPSKSPSLQVTNIGKVEIRNDFKEQLQPDRIAFSLKEQLMKVAQNPTQARGSSFALAFANGIGQ